MAASEHLSPAQFFHGSDHPFEPGDVIRPGGAVGRSNHELSAEDRVYLTSNAGIAEVFAQDFVRPGRTPAVYEVHPHDPAEVRGTGHEFTAAHAVVKRRVHPDEVRRLAEAWEEDD